MKLRELAERSGVSTASIKYYIRLGVLPAGEKKNATTSVYAESHLHRLTLITWIRRELDLPMAAISALSDAIADESISNLELMGISQNLSVTASGPAPDEAVVPAPDEADVPALAEVDAPAPTEAYDPVANEANAPAKVHGTPLATTGPEQPRRGSDQDFAAEVHGALSHLGWPDVSGSAVDRVATALDDLTDAGYEVGEAFVMRHARALAEIARENTIPITDGLSRDEICLAVIRGVTLHNRLLLAMSALTHAAMAAQTRNPQH